MATSTILAVMVGKVLGLWPFSVAILPVITGTSLTAMNVQAELADVQRRLRALQKKCSKRRLMQERTQKARRCAPTSRACLFVFVQSGRATELAVDFVSGRGWNTSGQLLDEQERQELAAEIEWAYIRAPLEDIVMLETKPQELCSWQDLVAGTRFIVEHMLFAWLQRQNAEQGLARVYFWVCLADPNLGPFFQGFV